jgi:SnoaL-like domain
MAVDDILVTYFGAWNEPDAGERRRMLERALADDAELIDPTGCWRGVAGFGERIGRYQAAAPGARVVPASGVDAHNDVVRYAWKIVDPHGRDVMEGLDVVERIEHGKLRRIVMFHGPLPDG